MLYLDGKSGTTYYYIHLNNDLTNGNDNRGGCRLGVTVPEGPARAARASSAGQPIGYVGDSGDANGIHPHLHFEVHPHGGRSIGPVPTPPRGAPDALLRSARLDVHAVDDRHGRRLQTTNRCGCASTRFAHRPGTWSSRRLDRPLVLTVPSYASIERGVAGNIVQLADAKRRRARLGLDGSGDGDRRRFRRQGRRDQRGADRSAGCLTAVPQDKRAVRPLGQKPWPAVGVDQPETGGRIADCELRGVRRPRRIQGVHLGGAVLCASRALASQEREDVLAGRPAGLAHVVVAVRDLTGVGPVDCDQSRR